MPHNFNSNVNRGKHTNSVTLDAVTELISFDCRWFVDAVKMVEYSSWQLNKEHRVLLAAWLAAGRLFCWSASRVNIYLHFGKAACLLTCLRSHRRIWPSSPAHFITAAISLHLILAARFFLTHSCVASVKKEPRKVDARNCLPFWNQDGAATSGKGNWRPRTNNVNKS